MIQGGISRLGTGVTVALVMGACDPPDPWRPDTAAAEAVPTLIFPDGESGEQGGTGTVAIPAAPGAFEFELVEFEPSVEDFADARFPRPANVRGLYVNAWAAGSKGRMDALLDIVRETEVNSLVIDIKDATGYLSHRTEVELAHEIGATEQIRIADLPALLDRLEAEGVYPIARIVIVKDPILSAQRPELAIQDTAGGVWIDSKGIIWLNPYSDEVWRYHADIAREVALMGFPEIQWDYVRFPDAPQADLDRAVYNGREGRERPEAIRGFLEYAKANMADLPVRSTADVFGVTTSYSKDVGTGQVWEALIDVVDVALPMVYPSHYWQGSFGYAHPNARPYEIVRRALEDAVERSADVAGAGLTRPWLQDFSLGEPFYSGAEVRAQIQATYDAGVDEWILWNPGTSYTVAALEPIGGFEHEPLVRVAGVLAPVSRRHIVIDSVAALPAVVAAQAEEPEAGDERAATDPGVIMIEPAEPDIGAVVPESSVGVSMDSITGALAPDWVPPVSDTIAGRRFN